MFAFSKIEDNLFHTIKYNHSHQWDTLPNCATDSIILPFGEFLTTPSSVKSPLVDT